MKYQYAVISVAAVALLAAGCGSSNANNQNQPQANTPTNTLGGETAPSPTPTAAYPQTVNFPLAAQNGSKETGSATLTATGTSTLVAIQVAGEPKGASQPAHIHAGSCPNPGNVIYPLKDVVNGKSQSTVNASLDAILGQLPLAINVHESARNINKYVSCGDISPQ